MPTDQLFQAIGYADDDKADRGAAIGCLLDGIGEPGPRRRGFHPVELVGNQHHMTSGQAARQRRDVARLNTASRQGCLTSFQVVVLNHGCRKHRFRQIASQAAHDIFKAAVERAGVSADHVTGAAGGGGHEIDERRLAPATLAVEHDMRAIERDGAENSEQFRLPSADPA